ncbi:MAG: outer membrane lipid asymmetry maintenance protein MlaD [Gammaproteobacteria bacterium]
MMKNRNLELSVGLLVLLSLASLLMLALQVSGLSDFNTQKGYVLNLEFANIGGLKVRSKVAIGGVTIGRVTAIKLNAQDYSPLVEVLIHSEYQLPLDTQASILTAGLLGDNYIGLSPGYDKEMFKPGGTIELASTQSAVVLENLISKFVADKAEEKPQEKLGDHQP